MLRLLSALDHPDISIGKITVCRSRFFVIAKMKFHFGKSFCLLTLTADIRLEIDPLRNTITREIHINDCRLSVRMDTTPILDVDEIRLLHQLTAAGDRHARIVYESEQIAAVVTIEELTMFHLYPFLSEISLLSCPRLSSREASAFI